MKNRCPKSLLTAGFLMAGLSSASLAAAMPDSVDINLQESYPALAETAKDTKSAPAFSHGKHAEIFLKNNSSHAGTPYTDQFTCVACHAGVSDAGEIGTETARQKQITAVQAAGSVKNYMHGICLDCHRSMKKATATSGPTSCKACHSPR